MDSQEPELHSSEPLPLIGCTLRPVILGLTLFCFLMLLVALGVGFAWVWVDMH